MITDEGEARVVTIVNKSNVAVKHTIGNTSFIATPTAAFKDTGHYSGLRILKKDIDMIYKRLRNPL
jgi:hypothetical protein